MVALVVDRRVAVYYGRYTIKLRVLYD